VSASGAVGIGLIGAGWIGSLHGRNAAACPYARLVAVCDTDIVKCDEFLARSGLSARKHTHYQNLLAHSDVDAVIIASPNALHAEHAVVWPSRWRIAEVWHRPWRRRA